MISSPQIIGQLMTNNWAFTYHEHQYLTIHLTSYDNAECKVSEVSPGFRGLVFIYYLLYYMLMSLSIFTYIKIEM